MDPQETRRSTPRRHRLWWFAVVAWMGIIFRLSALHGTQVPLPGALGELGHFAGYTVLGTLTCLALDVKGGARRAIALSIIIGSAYGISDELHQSFVPGRTPDVFDWGVDTLGTAAGAILTAATSKGAALRRPLGARHR